MRPSGEAPPSPSATPIYDELYAEWRRSFKALPGDHSGEEDLGFTPFGHMQHPLGRHPHHEPPPPTWQHLPQRPGGFPAALPPGPRRER
ncbi:hypothetical protein H9Y04_22340 [Streptomyces sp. TRM66268-LWL]|uniref:Uncharacterized protein n=1 Tax=Streptomyces polyasparticus TaxID=2767826 RepID=A0ABR7SJ44_9ACTN|nr:hypothetical protein [Streptomyces polyasparticus]MBC9715294.1 hypothetical protein [Streptomyces polyasparticus]